MIKNTYNKMNPSTKSMMKFLILSNKRNLAAHTIVVHMAIRVTTIEMTAPSTAPMRSIMYTISDPKQSAISDGFPPKANMIRTQGAMARSSRVVCLKVGSDVTI